MELFKKISTFERLPEKEGENFTDLGEVQYFKRNDGKFTICNGLHTVEWWFEKIEFPTDNDIENVAMSYNNAMSSMAEGVWMPQGFKEGVKWIRKKLLG